jgi:hypothetical protein
MSVRRILPAVPTDIREWTRFLSGLFFSRTFTASLTQCTTTPTGTVKYTTSAGIVVLQIPAITGISNATGGALVGLPEEIRPPNTGLTQYVPARITDNSVTAFGLVAINHTDTMSILTGAAGGGFTAAGTKGIQYCTVAYSID